MQDPWIGVPGQIATGVAIGVILLVIPISLPWPRRRLIAWWDRTAVSMQFSTAESDFQKYRKKVEIDGGEQAVDVRGSFRGCDCDDQFDVSRFIFHCMRRTAACTRGSLSQSLISAA